MLNLITEHIDIWTSASTHKSNTGRGRSKNTNGIEHYGINKLRELILELAVRGKLVPQDPNDVPASILLKKIDKEKAQLIKDGKIKTQRPLPIISDNEKPFELPNGWDFVRLGNITSKIGSGSTPSGGKSVYVDSGIPFIRSQNVWNHGLEMGDVVYIDDNTHQKMSNTMVLPNDILLNITGASLGRSTIYPESLDEANVSQHVTIIRPIDSYTKHFLHLCILSPYTQSLIWGRQVGMAREGLSKKVLELFEIPIPPLEEQHRIVAKVDELMVLCDQLEQQQSNQYETHNTLVETLLSALTNAENHKEFQKTWATITEYFDILFTTEQSIDQLKQSILQLAVMGKLVPQDPNDEPASVLLKKIAKEKVQLVKEGKIKKQKPLPLITDDEKPFELPDGWEWARIGSSTLFSEYGMSEKTFDDIEGIPVLKMGDIQNGRVILGGQKKVRSNVDGLPNLFLKKWDLLYNRTNSAELVGKTGIYEGPNDEYTFASYLIRIRCDSSYFLPKYLNLYMNSSYYRKTQIEPHLKQQCGQANVNGTIMNNMLVSVPPINEQFQIVAKVDELMNICDKLKDRLIELKLTQMRLSDTFIL